MVSQGREDMPRKTIVTVLSSLSLAAVAAAAIAADVTPQRLVNARSEPQNWLMIHHDYDNSRHSALNEINRDTVKNLELKYTFSIGGRSTGGIMRGKEESTPLVEDGHMYVTDTWSRVMKFDVHSGISCVPLRTSNFITRDQVSVTYMWPSSTSGVDSSLPRMMPPVERPPMENVYLSSRFLTVSRLISLSAEWRELS